MPATKAMTEKAKTGSSPSQNAPNNNNLDNLMMPQQVPSLSFMKEYHSASDLPVTGSLEKEGISASWEFTNSTQGIYDRFIQGVHYKERKALFSGKLPANCFSANKAVTWVLANTNYTTVPEAVQFLQKLKLRGFIGPLSGDTRVVFEPSHALWIPLKPISVTVLASSQPSTPSPRSPRVMLTANTPLDIICARMSAEIQVKDRIEGLIWHRKTFIGSEAVDWLVQNLTFVEERSEAISMAKLMYQKNLILSTFSSKKEKDFSDSKNLYRFSTKILKHKSSLNSSGSTEGVVTFENQAFHQVGLAFDQNERKRKAMEDEHMIVDSFGDNPNLAYFGIYDGHGGRGCVDILSQILHCSILEQRNEGKVWKECFEKAYTACDQEVCQKLRAKDAKDHSGCTSASVILETDPNTNKSKLYVANIGDTRVVLVRKGIALRLTEDHNSKTNQTEVQRIKDAGGYVFGKKVGGQLSVTRAFGDHHLKECGVISDPFYREIELEKGDSHMIVACDGLWDVISDQKAVDVLLKTDTAQAASSKLLKMALETSGDNVSVMVIKFNEIQ